MGILDLQLFENRMIQKLNNIESLFGILLKSEFQQVLQLFAPHISVFSFDFEFDSHDMVKQRRFPICIEEVIIRKQIIKYHSERPNVDFIVVELGFFEVDQLRRHVQRRPQIRDF